MKPIIRTLYFDRGQGIRTDITVDAWKDSRDKGILWLDMQNPEVNELKILEESFHFHHLNVEDSINVHHRPKVEEYPEYAFMVMHAIIAEQPKHVGTTVLSLFFGRDFVVTVHPAQLPFLDKLFVRCQQNPVLIEKGPDFLVYSLADDLVDEYFPLLDRFESKLSRLEDKMFHRPDNRIVNEILTLRRELLELRKVLGPQRDLFNILLRLDFPFTANETRVYLMDVYDHVLRIFDMVETYRDLVGGSMEVYLTTVSNRVNDIVKTLTIVATVAIPATVITGIYGMNFAIPELSLRYGYFMALGLMALSTGLMLLFFRNKKWL